MRLTKEQLTRKGFRRKDVTIPDVDGVVSIRELSAAEVRDHAKRCEEVAKANSLEANNEILAQTVILGLVDEQGNPMFGPEDVESVKGMGLATLNHLAGEIARFSGINASAAAASDLEKKDAGN